MSHLAANTSSGSGARRIAVGAGGVALAALGVTLPGAVAGAQDLGGTWIEAWSSESVQIRSWGEHCGPQPRARGRVASGRRVAAQYAGGVLSFPALGLRSDECKYVSLARKTSYGGLTLRCATPVGAVPNETATYQFTSSAEGRELRYQVRVAVFWKLEGDTCSAEVRYERLFQREEAPVVAEPVASAPPGAAPAASTPTPPASVASVVTPGSVEDAQDHGLLLIPVEFEARDRGEGPSGGSATPVVSRPRPAQRTGEGGAPIWIALALGALVLGTVGAFLLAFALRRRERARWREESGDAAESTPQPRSPRPDPNAAYARTMLLQAVSAVGESGAAGGVSAERVAAPAVVSNNPTRPADTLDEEPGAPGPTDRLDTSVAAMACPRCGRRYEMGAGFCPYDGQRLSGVEDATPIKDASILVCPRCSRRYPEGASFCAEDGEPLVAQEELEDEDLASPMLICPTCQREFMPGLAACPDDQTALLPLIGRRTTGLPVVGAGPRTRICPECGTRYPGDVGFCGLDGAHLVHVN